MKPPLTHDDWVQFYLKRMRAERRQRRTIITGTGASHRVAITDDKGERIIYGPTGRPVRIIEWEGGNQIEQHDDRLHAVVRPAARFKLWEEVQR